MKKKLFILLVLLLTACNNEAEQAISTATAVPIAQSTNTPTPTSTSTSTPLPEPITINTPKQMATNTAEPTQTLTDTPTPTITATTNVIASSTAANTETPTSTSNNTPTPVPVIPTETGTPLPTPDIPLYPNTPVLSWDQGAFISSVSALPGLFHSFYDYFGRIANGTPIVCYEFWQNYYDNWERSPAFTDVPPDWQSRYIEYRSILNDIRTPVLPIIEICNKNDGVLNTETEQYILNAILDLEARAIELSSAVSN